MAKEGASGCGKADVTGRTAAMSDAPFIKVKNKSVDKKLLRYCKGWIKFRQ